VRGSGASFSNPLYMAWARHFNKLGKGVVIDYQKKKGLERNLRHHQRPCPLWRLRRTDERRGSQKAPGLVHIPTVAGPVAIVYNLPGVEALALDGPSIVAIFSAKLKRWRDPRLVALNPGVKLPDGEITAVRRSDGSGTTHIFTDYLGAVSAQWKTKVGVGKAVRWPSDTVGGKGNDGVAQIVKRTRGAIGYVELKYATSAKLDVAAIVNAAGHTVKPTPDSVTAAAAAVEAIPEDLVLRIINAPGKGSYPIAAFTYLLVYRDASYLPAKEGVALKTFLRWAVTDGQKMAKPKQYAPLPELLQKRVLAVIDAIKVKPLPAAKKKGN
jgi:phosphate transport system substrate-binding protein